ncbi:MAG: ArsR/SmtB family transcription factor [Gemmataceae bacterium]
MARSNGKRNDDVVKSSTLLKAVADQDRLRLILQMKGGKKNVSTLADAIGAEIVNVSHHLGVLRASELVKAEKVGRFVYYSLNPEYVSQEGGALHFKLHGSRLILNV